MGYKRTSKKTGATSRRTTTINNGNGSVTNSNSYGSKNFRTTYTNNSKTGNKVTQTWRDGAGFTHRKTVYKSPTAASMKKQQREAQKFWAWLGGNSTKKKPVRKKSTGSFSGFGWLFLIVLAAIVVFGGK